jgi:hypothetical protein
MEQVGHFEVTYLTHLTHEDQPARSEIPCCRNDLDLSTGNLIPKSFQVFVYPSGLNVPAACSTTCSQRGLLSTFGIGLGSPSDREVDAYQCEHANDDDSIFKNGRVREDHRTIRSRAYCKLAS